MSDATEQQTTDDQTAAARQAADEALNQAKDMTAGAITSLKTLDSPRLIYLGALAFFVVATLLFDMASFSVGVDYAVSETVAQAQRDLQARMNSWSYSIFGSTMWGKLAWLCAVAGVVMVVASVIKNLRAAWIPLAEIGLAALCTMLMMLLFAIGFPDLSAYDDASCSATLLGFWLPFAASVTATVVSIRRLA